MLAGETLARTTHFALHGMTLAVPVSLSVVGQPSSVSRPLFAVRDVWLGAMVPKRWAKRAVTRNAIKRQIYAVSLDCEPSLAIAAHVVRLRCSFDRKLFTSATSEALKTAVRLELQQLFARAKGLPPDTKTGNA